MTIAKSATSTRSAGVKHRLKIGLLGSGTVGEAVQELVFKGKLEDKTGVAVEIVKIYTRHPKGKRWYAKYPSLFTTKPREVTDHPDVEILVEVLGAQQEKDLSVFKNYLIRAMEQGKSVVTSDKAVLAKFGGEIWDAADRYGQSVGFEACVGGGIPIIRSLRESLCAEDPEAIFGIVNGTCNYILSSMKTSGQSYEVSLREAQKRGFAETNPKADTSGLDSEAKLILLGAVTFGVRLQPGMILRKGIEKIHPIDFQYAHLKGFGTIKSLVVARDVGGAIEAYVSPVLVSNRHFLSTVDGITNAICFKGKRSRENADGERKGDRSPSMEERDWNYAFIGPGAGGGPTAVAVMGDVCSLTRPRNGEGGRLLMQNRIPVQSEDRIGGDFYVRFIVKDQSGIVGDICRIFGRKGIHIAEVWQLDHTRAELEELASACRLKKTGTILPFVITLERTNIGRLKKAMEIIRQKDFILVEPLWIPLWGI